MSAPHDGPYREGMENSPTPTDRRIPLAEMTVAERRAFIDRTVRKNSRLQSGGPWERALVAMVDHLCARYEARHAQRRAEIDAEPEQPRLFPEADL
jgi:hypothetical protein